MSFGDNLKSLYQSIKSKEDKNPPHKNQEIAQKILEVLEQRPDLEESPLAFVKKIIELIIDNSFPLESANTQVYLTTALHSCVNWAMLVCETNILPADERENLRDRLKDQIGVLERSSTTPAAVLYHLSCSFQGVLLLNEKDPWAKQSPGVYTRLQAMRKPKFDSRANFLVGIFKMLANEIMRQVHVIQQEWYKGVLALEEMLFCFLQTKDPLHFYSLMESLSEGFEQKGRALEADYAIQEILYQLIKKSPELDLQLTAFFGLTENEFQEQVLLVEQKSTPVKKQETKQENVQLDIKDSPKETTQNNTTTLEYKKDKEASPASTPNRKMLCFAHLATTLLQSSNTNPQKERDIRIERLVDIIFELKNHGNLAIRRAVSGWIKVYPLLHQRNLEQKRTPAKKGLESKDNIPIAVTKQIYRKLPPVMLDNKFIQEINPLCKKKLEDEALLVCGKKVLELNDKFCLGEYAECMNLLLEIKANWKEKTTYGASYFSFGRKSDTDKLFEQLKPFLEKIDTVIELVCFVWPLVLELTELNIKLNYREALKPILQKLGENNCLKTWQDSAVKEFGLSASELSVNNSLTTRIKALSKKVVTVIYTIPKSLSADRAEEKEDKSKAVMFYSRPSARDEKDYVIPNEIEYYKPLKQLWDTCVHDLNWAMPVFEHALLQFNLGRMNINADQTIVIGLLLSNSIAKYYSVTGALLKLFHYRASLEYPQLKISLDWVNLENQHPDFLLCNNIEGVFAAGATKECTVPMQQARLISASNNGQYLFTRFIENLQTGWSEEKGAYSQKRQSEIAQLLKREWKDWEKITLEWMAIFSMIFKVPAPGISPTSPLNWLKNPTVKLKLSPAFRKELKNFIEKLIARTSTAPEQQLAGEFLFQPLLYLAQNFFEVIRGATQIDPLLEITRRLTNNDHEPPNQIHKLARLAWRRTQDVVVHLIFYHAVPENFKVLFRDFWLQEGRKLNIAKEVLEEGFRLQELAPKSDRGLRDPELFIKTDEDWSHHLRDALTVGENSEGAVSLEWFDPKTHQRYTRYLKKEIQEKLFNENGLRWENYNEPHTNRLILNLGDTCFKFFPAKPKQQHFARALERQLTGNGMIFILAKIKHPNWQTGIPVQISKSFGKDLLQVYDESKDDLGVDHFNFGLYFVFSLLARFENQQRQDLSARLFSTGDKTLRYQLMVCEGDKISTAQISPDQSEDDFFYYNYQDVVFDLPNMKARLNKRSVQQLVLLNPVEILKEVVKQLEQYDRNILPKKQQAENKDHSTESKQSEISLFTSEEVESYARGSHDAFKQPLTLEAKSIQLSPSHRSDLMEGPSTENLKHLGLQIQVIQFVLNEYLESNEKLPFYTRLFSLFSRQEKDSEEKEVKQITPLSDLTSSQSEPPSALPSPTNHSRVAPSKFMAQEAKLISRSHPEDVTVPLVMSAQKNYDEVVKTLQVYLGTQEQDFIHKMAGWHELVKKMKTDGITVEERGLLEKYFEESIQQAGKRDGSFWVERFLKQYDGMLFARYLGNEKLIKLESALFAAIKKTRHRFVELELRNMLTLTPVDFKQLLNESRLTLESLLLVGISYPEESLQNGISKCRKLQQLQLIRCTNVTSQTVVKILKSCLILQGLVLKELPKLERISDDKVIKDDSIEVDQLEWLLLIENPALRILRLKAPKLQRLAISNCDSLEIGIETRVLVAAQKLQPQHLEWHAESMPYEHGQPLQRCLLDLMTKESISSEENQVKIFLFAYMTQNVSLYEKVVGPIDPVNLFDRFMKYLSDDSTKKFLPGIKTELGSHLFSSITTEMKSLLLETKGSMNRDLTLGSDMIQRMIEAFKVFSEEKEGHFEQAASLAKLKLQLQVEHLRGFQQLLQKGFLNRGQQQRELLKKMAKIFIYLEEVNSPKKLVENKEDQRAETTNLESKNIVTLNKIKSNAFQQLSGLDRLLLEPMKLSSSTSRFIRKKIVGEIFAKQVKKLITERADFIEAGNKDYLLGDDKLRTSKTTQVDLQQQPEDASQLKRLLQLLSCYKSFVECQKVKKTSTQDKTIALEITTLIEKNPQLVEQLANHHDKKLLPRLLALVVYYEVNKEEGLAEFNKYNLKNLAVYAPTVHILWTAIKTYHCYDAILLPCDYNDKTNSGCTVMHFIAAGTNAQAVYAILQNFLEIAPWTLLQDIKYWWKTDRPIEFAKTPMVRKIFQGEMDKKEATLIDLWRYYLRMLRDGIKRLTTGAEKNYRMAQRYFALSEILKICWNNPELLNLYLYDSSNKQVCKVTFYKLILALELETSGMESSFSGHTCASILNGLLCSTNYFDHSATGLNRQERMIYLVQKQANLLKDYLVKHYPKIFEELKQKWKLTVPLLAQESKQSQVSSGIKDALPAQESKRKTGVEKLLSPEVKDVRPLSWFAYYSKTPSTKTKVLLDAEFNRALEFIKTGQTKELELWLGPNVIQEERARKGRLMDNQLEQFKAEIQVSEQAKILLDKLKVIYVEMRNYKAGLASYEKDHIQNKRDELQRVLQIKDGIEKRQLQLQNRKTRLENERGAKPKDDKQKKMGASSSSLQDEMQQALYTLLLGPVEQELIVLQAKHSALIFYQLLLENNLTVKFFDEVKAAYLQAQAKLPQQMDEYQAAMERKLIDPTSGEEKTLAQWVQFYANHYKHSPKTALILTAEECHKIYTYLQDELDKVLTKIRQAFKLRVEEESVKIYQQWVHSLDFNDLQERYCSPLIASYQLFVTEFLKNFLENDIFKKFRLEHHNLFLLVENLTRQVLKKEPEQKTDVLVQSPKTKGEAQKTIVEKVLEAKQLYSVEITEEMEGLFFAMGIKFHEEKMDLARKTDLPRKLAGNKSIEEGCKVIFADILVRNLQGHLAFHTDKDGNSLLHHVMVLYAQKCFDREHEKDKQKQKQIEQELIALKETMRVLHAHGGSPFAINAKGETCYEYANAQLKWHISTLVTGEEKQTAILEKYEMPDFALLEMGWENVFVYSRLSFDLAQFYKNYSADTQNKLSSTFWKIFMDLSITGIHRRRGLANILRKYYECEFSDDYLISEIEQLAKDAPRGKLKGSTFVKGSEMRIISYRTEKSMALIPMSMDASIVRQEREVKNKKRKDELLQLGEALAWLGFNIQNNEINVPIKEIEEAFKQLKAKYHPDTLNIVFSPETPDYQATKKIAQKELIKQIAEKSKDMAKKKKDALKVLGDKEKDPEPKVVSHALFETLEHWVANLINQAPHFSRLNLDERNQLKGANKEGFINKVEVLEHLQCCSKIWQDSVKTVQDDKDKAKEAKLKDINANSQLSPAGQILQTRQEDTLIQEEKAAKLAAELAARKSALANSSLTQEAKEEVAQSSNSQTEISPGSRPMVPEGQQAFFNNITGAPAKSAEKSGETQPMSEVPVVNKQPERQMQLNP